VSIRHSLTVHPFSGLLGLTGLGASGEELLREEHVHVTRTSGRQLALIYTEKAEVELTILDRSEQSLGWHGSSQHVPTCGGV
jgi:hypothetical protein